MVTIQRMTSLSVLLLALSWLPMSLQGEDKLGYVLAPLRTEFHRTEISSKASALLVVNANAVKAENDSDLFATRHTQLASDLRKLSAKANGLLLIRLQSSGAGRASKDVIDRLKEQLKELATRSGFQETQITEEWTSEPWESGSASLGTGLMDDPGEENLIMNKALIAAPLRTRISKLKGGMGDMYIKLRSPIDARNLQLSDETKEMIRIAVRSMEPSPRRKLHFYVSSTRAGAEAVDKLFSNRQPPAIPEDAPAVIKELLLQESKSLKKSPALQLAQDLGFQEIGCTHSSSGGAPELLVGKRAPDFELTDFDGSVVKWPEWRRGRPALITFWGVACGPCRLEAPHLSRLHEKFGADIAIMAVNAYDETNEAIREYVTKEKLKHQVVVGGGTLAKSTYNVGAYPTTFWINRDGEVVRYVVGFESGEQLEKELVEFLTP